MYRLFHILIAFINIANKKWIFYIWQYGMLIDSMYILDHDIVKNVIFSLSFIVSEFRLKFTGGRSTTLINAVAGHKSSLGTLHLTYDTGAIVRTMMEL